MRSISVNQAQKEVIISENFKALEQASVFGWKVQATTGLQYGYWGGSAQNNLGVLITVGDGTITLTANTTNYVYFNTTTNVIATSTTIPVNGNLRIARVITDATKITNVFDERLFALIPVGTPSNLQSSSGGNAFLTDKADWEVKNVVGLVVTLKGAQAYMGLPMEYTSTFLQSLSSDTNITLPANSSGFIVQTSGGPLQYITSISAKPNIFGVLYSYTTNSTSVTKLVDCSRSNFTRVIGIVYETSIAVTGNLSKANTFTAPYAYQNSTGNLSSAFRYEAYLKCLTAEFGYSAGDLLTNFLTGPVGGATTLTYPATIQIKSGSGNGNLMNIILDAAIKAQRLDSSIGTVVDLTPANWQMRCRIYPLR